MAALRTSSVLAAHLVFIADVVRSVGSVANFLSHSRFLLTLRSNANKSVYKSLILFRLAAAGDDNDQIYVMESACPHLGADMSHADIEDGDHGSLIAVCPWHRSVSGGKTVCPVIQLRLLQI